MFEVEASLHSLSLSKLIKPCMIHLQGTNLVMGTFHHNQWPCLAHLAQTEVQEEEEELGEEEKVEENAQVEEEEKEMKKEEEVRLSAYK